MSYSQTVYSDHVHQLLNLDETPCVSMHLPMERMGPDTRKNPIELKNALRRARQLLEEREVPAKEIEACLAPAENLLGNSEFFQHQQSALALYLAPEAFRPFVLDVPVEARVEVGERFSVLPLLASMDRAAKAFVLLLSEKVVRLFRWRFGHLQEVLVPDLPTNFQEALQLDPEQSLQGHVVTHAGGKPVAGVHGQGGGKDLKQEYRTEFMQRVNEAIANHLRLETAPLVLATVRSNFALYRKINTYGQLADVFVEGNYDHVSQSELVRALSGELQERHLERLREELVSLRQAEGEGLASADVAELVRAAQEGRMRRLFVSWPPPVVTGQWQAGRHEATLDPNPDPMHEDLLDLAAAETWRQGGAVRVVPSDWWNRDEPCAGELRWKDGSE